LIGTLDEVRQGDFRQLDMKALMSLNVTALILDTLAWR
jgi:hypothetical protein